MESVLINDYPNYQVIVIDNNSPNNSMEYIKKWAEGKLNVWVKPDHPLRHLSFPPIKKPITYVYYTREEAEKGGNSKLEANLNRKMPEGITTKYPLVFIQAGKNLGFAGGNNVGIRYALTKNDFEYIWFLNNDTVIEKDALSKMVQKFEKYKKEGKKVGILGSKLLYYDRPEIIQGIGGIYNKWFAVAKHLGIFEEDKGQYDNEEVIDKIDYIIGASMLVSKEFIEEVGVMCEDYFLYFEEMDWTLRGKKKGYQLGYCWKSKVYHKEGGSIGSSSKGNKKSEIADYYGLRNRIVFTKKFYPKYLWSVYLGFVVVIWNRVRRGQIKIIPKILKILFI
ncbi:glycosyltransferase family 2 protein [Desulfurobacterium atlanticum]|uniref:glycosyltransferase n=1 Tax=Desulfurobacterium atlanticum TaxID=240169 RepID=UPI001FE74F67